MKNLTLSVIVSTYNNPHALELVLAGLSRQTLQPDEILIADDGSGPETRETIERARSFLKPPVRHIRHEDNGFQKWRILNRAIAEAEKEYLVIFDGDCIPRPSCLATHTRLAEKNRYIAGGKVMLSAEVTNALTPDAVRKGLLDRPGEWVRGAKNRHRLYISRIPGLRRLADLNKRTPPCWRGENSSTFAEHLRQVGGFDERFTYGYGDADLGHRLDDAGILGYSIRYTEPVLHLEHERPYANKKAIAENKKIYDENRAAHVTWTPYGLKKNTEADV